MWWWLVWQEGVDVGSSSGHSAVMVCFRGLIFAFQVSGCLRNLGEGGAVRALEKKGVKQNNGGRELDSSDEN